MLSAICEARQLDIVDVPYHGRLATIGSLEVPAPEAFFLLHYLSEKYLIEFDTTWSGGGAVLVNMRATSIGLQHLAQR